MNASLRRIIFAVVLSSVCFSMQADAVEITNKSDSQIGAAILREDGEQKNLLFVKILQPGTSLDVTPDQQGPYLISVKVFDTDETLRLRDVAASAVIDYENGTLNLKN